MSAPSAWPKAEPLQTRELAHAIARHFYGGAAPVADLVEQLVLGDHAERADAAEALQATPQEPARFKSTLPDPDSPRYREYRRLGKAGTLLATVSEWIELTRSLDDPALAAALLTVYGRALEHVLAAQRGLGLRR